MVYAKERSLSYVNRKNANFNLASFWVTGLILGTWLFCTSDNPATASVRSAASGSVSLLNLLLCVWMPFLLSALAIRIHAPFILGIICLCKAASLIFVSCAVFAAFGQSAWLVHALLLFSDLLGSVVLIFFLLRFGSGLRNLSPAAVCGYAFILFLIVCADYRFIFPLLQRVVSF